MHMCRIHNPRWRKWRKFQRFHLRLSFEVSTMKTKNSTSISCEWISNISVEILKNIIMNYELWIIVGGTQNVDKLLKPYSQVQSTIFSVKTRKHLPNNFSINIPCGLCICIFDDFSHLSLRFPFFWSHANVWQIK